MIQWLRKVFADRGELARDTRIEARETVRLVESVREKREALTQSEKDFPISGFLRDAPPRRRVRIHG